MNKIITISREFGSGGREVGKRLADELEMSYYDKEIITEISKETGMTEEYIKNISEKGIYPYAFQFAKSFAMYSGVQSNQTEILVAQQKILKEIAEKGNCIIIGRGADVILKEYNPMKLFVYSDMESKINRCKMKRKTVPTIIMMIFTSIYGVVDGIFVSSAIISFLRTLLFQIIMIFVLPMIWGLNGIWLAVVVAEILSLFVSIVFLIKNKKKYQYA